MKKSIVAAMTLGATALTYAAYRKEIDAARLRVRTGAKVIDSPYGPLEYADSGSGPAVLFIHGAGGGFDQGLNLARGILGDRYRIVAPSRFGYLGTALPADATPEAQADAHRFLLDELHLDKVPVIGASAGAPSAMQFCLRHPERCASLVLLVPLAYAPERAETAGRLPRGIEAALNTMTRSDFAFWVATKLAHIKLIETMLGTPAAVYRNATPAQRREVDRVLAEIQPISQRAKGLANESVIASSLTRYPLEKIAVPVLTISTADDGYGTYESAHYTAEQAHGKFVGFATGGHLTVGHEAEINAAVTAFVDASLRVEALAASES